MELDFPNFIALSWTYKFLLSVHTISNPPASDMLDLVLMSEQAGVALVLLMKDFLPTQFKTLIQRSV